MQDINSTTDIEVCETIKVLDEPEGGCDSCVQAGVHPDNQGTAILRIAWRRPFGLAGDKWVYLCKECAINGWNGRTRKAAEQADF